MYLCIQGDPKKCIIRILISNLFYMSDFTFPHVFWNQKKTHAFLAFLGHLWFSMGNIKMARWNGLKILIPKHMWKSKIGLLEQIWGQNPYDTFFLGHPVLKWSSNYMELSSVIYIQGDPKKMYHKDPDLKSVLEVQFYFSTCVLESEFWARFI